MTNLRKPIDPTIYDVGAVLEQTSNLIANYLYTKMIPNRDGFFPSRLSGDEDAETARKLEAIFPLVTLLHKMRQINPDRIALETNEDLESTWHSRQYEICACTGEETDSEIARIYRESIQ